MDLPEGVEQLNIQDGTVSLRASSDLCPNDLSLLAGDLELPLQPVRNMSEVPFYLPFTLGTDKLIRSFAVLRPPFGVREAFRLWRQKRRQAASGWGLCEAGVNIYPDWALSNSKTVQLQIFRLTPPIELELDSQAVVPAHQQPLRVRLLLAIHRGEADLHLDIVRGPEGERKRVTVPFDTSRLGGRNRESYQEVSIDLPPADCAVSLSLAVTYKRHVFSGNEDNDTFLFIASPEVVSRDNDSAPISNLQLFNRTIPGAIWYQARIPVRAAAWGSPLALTLIAGADRVTIAQPKDAAMRIVDDLGHSLVMRSGQPDRYTFFLNGQLAFAAQINSEDSSIRFPPEYLTGDTYHLTVRDASGLHVFLETYVLLPRILTPEDVLRRESKSPFPGALSAQAAHRYDALKEQVERQSDPDGLKQVAHALRTLEGGYDHVKLRPLVFPKPDAPDVSIVIPAYNKVEVTYFALCALLLANNEASFEVIVADDASTDKTRELEKIVSGITVIHNPESLRFIGACNAGAAQARGDYIVLLNNDTEPTTGWLDALIDAFGRFDNVGLAGAKLLYPSGRLQDAGGIIWGSGNPWNYGNSQNPWDPRFSYARQADYLSGAALMTTRKIWNAVGGLSDYLRPMYFEDTDFAFKVREAGYATWFVPASVVYHYEGMTSGTDVSTGFKKYQEINRPKFKRRWAKAYAGFGTEGVAPDLEKDRGITGRVLFVDYTTPRPDRDAGSYAAINEIRLVQSLGYKVTFLPQNLAHFGVYTEELQRDGVEVITAPFYLSVQEFLDKRGAEFDVIYITRYYVGEATIHHVRRVAPKAKVILNNADLHFLRQLRAGLANNDPEQIAEARKVRDAELAVLRKADLVLSYNEVEHSVIQSHTDGAVRVLPCPWVVDIPEKVPGIAGRTGLSFLGSFKHHPNLEGVLWFAETVMNCLGERLPDLRLSIYGSGMPPAVRDLKTDTINPVGFVENIADAYNQHRIFVAPLLSGAGIKGKVIAALAHGVPSVVTPVAAEGIGLRHGHDCMIASTPAEWVEAIVRLQQDDALWQAVSKSARDYARDRFSFSRGRAQMRAAFEAVDIYASRD